MGLFGLSLTYGNGRLAIYKKRAGSNGNRRRRMNHRSYAAGQAGGNLVASWTTTPYTADYIIKNELKNLRARSRELECTDPHAKRFLGLSKDNIAGPRGIRLQLRITDPDGTPDDLANDTVEQNWREWGRPENCDIEGGRSFVDLQRLFIGTVARDGEFLARYITGSGINDYGMALQILDPDLLDIGYNEVLSGGNYIKFGIEYNKWNRPVAYHLLDIDWSRDISTLASYHPGMKHVPIPAAKILHAFVPEMAGQKRGIPWMSTVMLNMKMRAGWMEASLVACRLGASKVGTITTPSGEGYVGDATSHDGGEGDQGGVEYIDAADPGSWVRLAEGEEMGGWNPDYPRSEFDPAVKRCLMSEAAGLEVDYPTYAGDLTGTSFASGRTGLMETREHWKGRQNWMIGAFNRPVYERWLEMSLLAGALKVMGKPLKVSREKKYQNVAWQPQRWQWIDPLKDMQANVLALENNLASHTGIITETGEDSEDVWKQKQKDQMLMDEYGVKAPQPKEAGNGQGNGNQAEAEPDSGDGGDESDADA